MSLFTKILIVFAVVLNLAYFCFAGALLSYQVHYKNRGLEQNKVYDTTLKDKDKTINDLDGQIQTANRDYATLQVNVNNNKIETDKNKDHIRELEAVIENLKNRIQEMEKNKTEFTRTRDRLKERNADLKTQVANYREQQQQFQKQSEQIQEDRQKVSDELAQDRKRNALLENSYMELSKKYLLLEQVLEGYKQALALKPVGPPPVPKVITGRIMATNPGGTIVVINKGSDDGVTLNMEFTVFRADKYIGKIIVDKVVDKGASTAVIITGMMKDTVQVNDEITTSPY